MLDDERFGEIRELGAVGFRRDGLGDRPLILRGIAGSWPAQRTWTWEFIRKLDPARRVRVVHGNREMDRTCFTGTSLGAFLAALEGGEDPGYLKEFDLLAAFPQLKSDLRLDDLLPPWSIRAHSAWIGPARAVTGLHYDYLDNMAVLVRGRKVLRLASPGLIERHGLVSRKHDRWATLAKCCWADLAALGGDRDSMLQTTLEGGDAVFIPKGWWHEVENLSATILMSGFFGPVLPVAGLWAWTSLRHLFHRRWMTSEGCTCHGA